MTPRSLTAVVLALATAGGLAACGRVGDLERPGPLFGARARADAAAHDAAADARGASAPTRPTAAADRADRDADNAPPTTRDLQAPQQDRQPISKEPIPGTHDLTGPTPSMTPN